MKINQIEILEIQSSKSQIKLVESFINREEDRISGLKDKADELDNDKKRKM
jgi:rubrerythrin